MKVLLVSSFAATGLPELQRQVKTPCQFVCFDGEFDEAAVLAEIEDADVVAGYPFTHKMGEAARQLRLIQNPGAGSDRYVAKNFPPGAHYAIVYNHEVAIAEHVLMMMLAFTKELIRYDAQFRRGSWEGSCVFGGAPTLGELREKTVGILGFGRIGYEIAGRARAFGMKVGAIKRNPGTNGREANEDAPKLDFLGGPDDLPRLLEISDYLVIACPLTRKTDGWIGAAELAQMKPGSFLINVSRGKVVQEVALYDALAAKRIAGAAIDVWYDYPASVEDQPHFPAKLPFHELDNVIMTPHISGWTQETLAARWRDMALNIDRVAAGLPPLNAINLMEDEP